MPRFELDDGDSDSDGEVEPAHPLGFDANPLSPWGKTWISLDPPSKSQYSRSGQSRYCLDDDEDLFIQSYPPISSYLSSKLAPTASLIRFDKEIASPLTSPKPYRRKDTDDDLYYSSADEDEEPKLANEQDVYGNHDDRDGIDENSDVTKLLQFAYQSPPARPRLTNSLHDSHSFASPKEIRQKRDEADLKIQQRVEAERKKIDKEVDQATAILGELILQSNQEAEAILKRRKAEEERLQKALAAKEDRERRLREEAEKDAARRKEQAEKDAAKAEKDASQLKAKEDAAKQKKQEIETKAKKKIEHIDRAKKLIGQLAQVRASVEPFDKNKAVGKRRLGMKKIAKGKVNTLNDNPSKIQEVATEISQAIARYDQEDAQLKEQLKQKVPGLTKDMALGRRYFVDLLASTAMTRVQAESFSGTKGDGFPLAAMLAMVSVEQKNLVLIMEAHIYTVCPTAIPTLPQPRKDATEDEIMIGLGMQRNKKTGDFESFPQFLARTENIVSFMAAIQSSLPTSHSLMGGNTGALKWLKHFLDLLPPAPTKPLPLITAPVLGAFLTIAGHMLANVHEKYFRPMLEKIQSDIVQRLDEGEIGKPSAIRLTKLLEGNFDGFKKNLPTKAIKDLYCGASEHSQKNQAVTSFAGTIGGEEDIQPQRGSSQQGQYQPTNGASPFGNSMGNSVPNPFGGGNNEPNKSLATSSNPFGGQPSQAPTFGGTTAPSQSPFGSAPSPSPFGQAQTFGGTTAPSPSPFGSAPSPSPFGQAQTFGGTTAPASSPFGAPAPASGGFGAAPATGFGAAPAPATGFGAPSTGFGAPASSPFGAPAPATGGVFGSTPAPAFGGGGMAPAPSPFGTPFGGAAPSPSPFTSNFGGGANNQKNAPFGGNGGNNQGFGSNNNGRRNKQGFGSNNNSFRGGKKLGPCKFFAQGRCKKGDNCQWSHDIGGGGNAGFGGGNNNWSGFGGPRR